MITLAEFRARFPEFASETEYPDVRITIMIEEADILMRDPTRWGRLYKPSQLYLTAHLLTLAEYTSTGTAGANFPINKQVVDDVEVGFAVVPVQPDIDTYLTTSYGQSYNKYLRMVYSGPYVV